MLKIWEVEYNNGDIYQIISDSAPEISYQPHNLVRVSYVRWIPKTKGQRW